MPKLQAVIPCGLLALLVLTLTACAPEDFMPAPPATAPPQLPPQPPGSATGSGATAVPDPARTVTINFSGDLLWHNTLWSSAKLDGDGDMDFFPQLAGIRDYVAAADLAICHSEVPFAKKGGPYSNYPAFQAPPQIGPALSKVGWDLCTTASNHSLDAGFSGLVRTLEVHAASGILTSGTYATKEARDTPVIFTTDDGVRVGVVSMTYGTNGIPLQKGKEWSVSVLDETDGLEQARRAREAGADVVVVHMHAGDEYSSSPNAQQRRFGEAMTASGDVDLVIGQHAHVVQPIDRVNGKWVAYGAGNLIAQSGPAQPRTYEGYLATFTFTEQPDGHFEATGAEYAPTFITKHSSGRPARVLLITDALRDKRGNANALRESAARTRKTVESLGAAQAGLVEWDGK